MERRFSEEPEILELDNFKGIGLQTRRDSHTKNVI